MKRIAMMLAPLVLLNACSTAPKKTLADLNCFELTRELGWQMSQRKDARINSVLGTIGSVVADDKKDRNAAATGSILSDIEGYQADKRIKTINQLLVKKGCKVN